MTRDARAADGPARASSIDVTRPMRGLSIADQQMVEIARALGLGQPAHHHGRADRAADPEGGRHAVRHRPPPARRGPHHRLHHAPARGSARAVRPRHHLPRRQQDRDRHHRQPHRCRHHPPDDRPAAEGIHAQDRRHDRRGGAEGRRPDAARRVQRHQFRGPQGRDRRARRPRRRRPHRCGARLFGVAPAASGTVSRSTASAVDITDPSQAIALGLAFVPEDRAVAGIFRTLSVEQNISAAVPGKIAPGGFIRRAVEKALATTRSRSCASGSPRCASRSANCRAATSRRRSSPAGC